MYGPAPPAFAKAEMSIRRLTTTKPIVVLVVGAGGDAIISDGSRVRCEQVGGSGFGCPVGVSWAIHHPSLTIDYCPSRIHYNECCNLEVADLSKCRPLPRVCGAVKSDHPALPFARPPGPRERIRQDAATSSAVIAKRLSG